MPARRLVSGAVIARSAIVCALAGLLGGNPVGAQTPPPQEVVLRLDAAKAQLIVETLSAIRCETVRALFQCEIAKNLVLDIQRQAQEQVK